MIKLVNNVPVEMTIEEIQEMLDVIPQDEEVFIEDLEEQK